jgi:hypothetical protein
VPVTALSREVGDGLLPQPDDEAVAADVTTAEDAGAELAPVGAAPHPARAVAATRARSA